MQPTNPKLYNPRIDQLRACGFLAVVAVHFFFPDSEQVLRSTPGVKYLAPLMENGQFGVTLFFFISGYILSRLVTAQGGTIDYKAFLQARALRILPLWFVCVAIDAFAAGLKGGDILALMALFTQNLPVTNYDSTFRIAWSIQAEFYLYLLFPILFVNVTSLKRLGALVCFCFAIRAMTVFIPVDLVRDMSCATIFGTVPVFALGIYAGRRLPWRLGKARLPLLALAVSLIYLVALFIDMNGEHFHASEQTRILRMSWLIYPEVLGALCFLLVSVYDSEQPQKKPNLGGQIFALIGKTSYSGYLLHIFTLNFISNMCIRFNVPLGPYPKLLFYLAILLPVAWLSFKVVEEPFLAMRKRYVRKLTSSET